ncbi:ATP-dependent helicase [Nocardia elegans]|uniref:DNA 3'-5' helicase n=1 Tax=Nocardia elegans TaxID=300029 RepID=A0ABW6TE21_9NOCA|nr:ATP-dependent helicase [Nocardia elegans]MBF6446570.1 ATP-dependent helicase [Nocardia elegans]
MTSFEPVRPTHLVTPDLWRPIGIEELEPAAWSALRADGCNAVTAGPGTGKTEFLAQRAAYLLQTGLCARPERILAISFKRDAAANLERRVRSRIPEHAHSFTSMTFDAFTKGLVDRFRTTIPSPWTLAPDYEISFFSAKEQEDFITQLADSIGSSLLKRKLHSLPAMGFLPEVIGSYPLPHPATKSTRTAEEFAARRWWDEHYLAAGNRKVDFVMINRLAELLVRRNPHLRRGLELTYPFVFIDEFQDTTYAQYSFLSSVFRNATITVVGDKKQRIMGWAGALDNAFDEFRADFSAQSHQFAWNFRSSEKLVELQHAIATKLDPEAATALSKVSAEIIEEPAQIWSFPNAQREAAVIADWIAVDSATAGRSPAQYALVARQKVAGFEPAFRAELDRHGISLRNDDSLVGQTRLQDLLKERISHLIVGIARLASSGGQASLWTEVSSLFARTQSIRALDDNKMRIAMDNLSTFIREHHKWQGVHPPTARHAEQAVDQIVSFLDLDCIQRELATHRPKDDVDRIITSIKIRLGDVSLSTDSWLKATQDYEAADAVPLLTIHRSKGLEYHTVFFLGLDDSQWWAHGRDPIESTSTFFVGLSRAGQRNIFTSSQERGGRSKIDDLYEVLQEVGIKEVHWD